MLNDLCGSLKSTDSRDTCYVATIPFDAKLEIFVGVKPLCSLKNASHFIFSGVKVFTGANYPSLKQFRPISSTPTMIQKDTPPRADEAKIGPDTFFFSNLLPLLAPGLVRLNLTREVVCID